MTDKLYKIVFVVTQHNLKCGKVTFEASVTVNGKYNVMLNSIPFYLLIFYFLKSDIIVG